MPILKGDCPVCDGFGDCPECGGSGYSDIMDQFVARNVAPLCGASEEDMREMESCDRCNGSGKCTYCGGTGRAP